MDTFVGVFFFCTCSLTLYFGFGVVHVLTTSVPVKTRWSHVVETVSVTSPFIFAHKIFEIKIIVV